MQFFKMHFMISFQSLVCASINTFKYLLGKSWMQLCETLDMAAQSKAVLKPSNPETPIVGFRNNVLAYCGMKTLWHFFCPRPRFLN